MPEHATMAGRGDVIERPEMTATGPSSTPQPLVPSTTVAALPAGSNQVSIMRRIEERGIESPMMDDRSHTTKRAGRPGRPARYEHDLYGWALQQAALLRAGRIDEADVRNIAEELDDVG